MIGERSAAMGNAYVAISNTPEALHFNPAGLASINKDLSMTAGINVPVTLDYIYKEPDGTVHHSKSVPIPPHVFLASKIGIVGLGLGWWVPIGGGTVKFTDVNSGNFTNNDETGETTDTTTTLLVHNIAASASLDLFDVVFIGANFNLHVGQIELELKNFPKDSTLGATFIDHVYEGTGTALGTYLGILFKEPFWDIFSVGFCYRMGYEMNTKGPGSFDINDELTNFVIDDILGLSLPAEFDATTSIYIPHMFVAGIAAHLGDNLLLSFEYQYSKWEDSQEIVLDWDWDIPEGLSQLTGLSPRNVIKTGYEDAYFLKGGVEYEILKQLPVRAGFLYGKESKRSYANSLLSIDPRGFIITYGVGYKLAMTNVAELAIDATFYHALGKEVQVSEADLAGKEEFRGPVGTYNRKLVFGFLVGLSAYFSFSG
ncbi:MAG: outer membrane protein transport protein [Myxococcota bacterium]|nr:outer membrane protein transport protein [Myxococcota bacterium]